MYQHFWSKVAAVQEGAEPLPCYELCGIQIQEGWITKHWQTVRCDKNAQMR